MSDSELSYTTNSRVGSVQPGDAGNRNGARNHRDRDRGERSRREGEAERVLEEDGEAGDAGDEPRQHHERRTGYERQPFAPQRKIERALEHDQDQADACR